MENLSVSYDAFSDDISMACHPLVMWHKRFSTISLVQITSDMVHVVGFIFNCEVFAGLLCHGFFTWKR